MTTAYPLTWPFGWARTKVREPARFHGTTRHYYDGGGSSARKIDLTISEARKRLWRECERLGVGENDFVISSNVPLRMDGMPRSDVRRVDDPGVAVYFKLKGKDRVLACDRWLNVADNIAAIAKHIEAIRGIERWGVGTIEQAFTGYTALPAPGNGGHRPWRDVLQPGAPPVAAWSREVAETAYRRLLAERHPDRGGSHEQAAELNAAIEVARQELGG